jgi:hypothetical protein
LRCCSPRQLAAGRASGHRPLLLLVLLRPMLVLLLLRCWCHRAVLCCCC